MQIFYLNFIRRTESLIKIDEVNRKTGKSHSTIYSRYEHTRCEEKRKREIPCSGRELWKLRQLITTQSESSSRRRLSVAEHTIPASTDGTRNNLWTEPRFSTWSMHCVLDDAILKAETRTGARLSIFYVWATSLYQLHRYSRLNRIGVNEEW